MEPKQSVEIGIEAATSLLEYWLRGRERGCGHANHGIKETDGTRRFPTSGWELLLLLLGDGALWVMVRLYSFSGFVLAMIPANSASVTGLVTIYLFCCALDD
jgi:hypothetical protein